MQKLVLNNLLEANMCILDLVSEKSERSNSYWSKLLISLSYTKMPLTQGRANRETVWKCITSHVKVAIEILIP